MTTTPTDLPPPGELPEFEVDPTLYRHLADSQMNVELDTGDLDPIDRAYPVIVSVRARKPR